MKKGFWAGLTLGIISATMLMQSEDIKGAIKKMKK